VLGGRVHFSELCSVCLLLFLDAESLELLLEILELFGQLCLSLFSEFVGFDGHCNFFFPRALLFASPEALHLHKQTKLPTKKE
jgi:hypothetical protein